MSHYDWSKRRQGQGELWRSSEGRLREAAPRPWKEGRDHLTGYEAAPRERGRGDRPREAARLSGSYGDVAVGVSRKKDVTLVVSKGRSREGPAATRIEQVLQAGSARRLNLARGDFRANSYDRENSALAYRESSRKPPAFMLKRFQEMMHTHDQDILDEMVPFLDRRPEEEELRRMAGLGDTLRAQGGAAERASLREVDSRKQRLRQMLAEKAVQERRLLLVLERAREEARRRTEDGGPLPWLLSLLSPQADEDLPEDEGGRPEDEGEGKNEKI